MTKALFGDPLPGWLLDFRSSGLVARFAKYNNIINILPDALWAYSGIALIGTIWSGNTASQIQARVWLAVAWLVLLLSELLQFFNLSGGTFDLNDLLVIVLGGALASFIFRRSFLGR
ncbi:MAG: hypothetical protein GY952_05815 [Rhodobacteraceae bacterium]|nr:hypothetical protein [Paracoccaceae bacterium]